MIQRIQSLYLLLAAGAFGGQYALPYLTATSTGVTPPPPVLADGALTPTDNLGLTSLVIMGAVLALAGIFMFKNRNLQQQAAGLGILVGILVLAAAGFAAKSALDGFTGNMQPGLGFGAAALAVLFSWLARRAIQADEKLVRSMDRLR